MRRNETSVIPVIGASTTRFGKSIVPIASGGSGKLQIDELTRTTLHRK
jgi:hypothetical protein